MVYNEQKALHNALRSFKNRGKTIGLVSTMSALYAGHLSLVKKVKGENDIVVVGIFANPTQFNNPTDLEKYLRASQVDAQLLYDFNPKVPIYAPPVADVYGDEAVAQHFDFGTLDEVTGGPSCPGCFDGVGIIVKKLFEIIIPDRAYFSERDYQRLLIIERMVAQTGLPVTVVPRPIVRNAEGLALNSRNVLFSEAIRQRATFVYRTLQ